MGFKPDAQYHNNLSNKEGISVHLNINNQNLALISKYNNYIQYKDVIKHIISLM